MQDAQSNKKNGYRFIIGLIAVLFTGCSDKSDNHAVSLVQETQTAPAAYNFTSAPFRGGVAVMANNAAGYWVFSDIVYATNSIAKEWSPDTKYSPPAIDQVSIEDAITNYQKDGTINSEKFGEVLTANINELLRLSKSNMNNKKAITLYFGIKENSFCELTSTFDYLRKSQGEIYTDKTSPEFSLTCNWDGGYFIIHDSWKTFTKLSFVESHNAEMNLNMTAELIETGKKGRVLKVTAKNIPFDISKAQ